MHLILLSGGSGKRLWPLSNDIRSKQFIPLLKNERGEYESMVQRVYGQIRKAAPEAGITIATSKSQVSAIHNQLGDNVSVCVEPCRRDTFPAIALAVAHLKDVQGAGEDEIAVVCPVDPYVDQSYYEAVVKLTQLAAKGAANLFLMGIRPTYPSEKYGYIIPEEPGDISMVAEFKEKPDLKTARGYLERGALWNAGVFAFRIGYLLEKARAQLGSSDYETLLKGYGDCKKISFDYAVAEGESKIQVMGYDGAWKDVGTWNTMAEVMSEPVKGNAVMDDTCTGTNIVNELDIPILCMGCKDMVIAASCDGILVADKDRSSHMKSYVEEIGKEARYAEKSWGTYTVIDTQSGSMTIKVTLRAGNRMKYHSHQHREEVWNVIAGSGRVIVEGEEQKVEVGSVIRVLPEQKHTLIADTDMNVIEVQIGEDIRKEDKVTYPDPESQKG